jgi:hypothetical protein
MTKTFSFSVANPQMLKIRSRGDPQSRGVYYGSREGTSDFRLQTSNIGSFRASLIANIAFAKLDNISGTYSIKDIQTKVKNGKHDLDCKCRL